MADEIKTGVYICTGCEIGNCIDIKALESEVTDENKVDLWKNHEFLCGKEAVQMINDDIKNEGINRIVLGACSGRVNTDVFNFGEEVFTDRAVLREYVAWTKTPNDEDTQMLAEDYVKMSIAKVENGAPAEPLIEFDSKKLLVVGGGVSGMTAAVEASKAGYEVVLVEKEDKLGGWAAKFKNSYPQNPPYDKLEDTGCNDLVKSVQDDSKISVHLSSTIKSISGQPGQFKVSLQNGGAPEEIDIGAIVQTTGWKPYDPNNLEYLGYGKCQNVVTNIEMEEMISSGDIKRKSDSKAPESIAFIQCAGSRDQDHLPYCSAVCCRVSLKHVMNLREKYPNAKIYVLYKDVRSPAQWEMFYAKVQQDDNVFFTKGEVVGVTEDGKKNLTIDLDDTLLGEKISVNAEMLVLAAGMVPSTKVDAPGKEAEGGEEAAECKTDGDDGDAGASAESGAKILNLTYRLGTDLPTLKYGFPDSHYICFPYETRRTAVYAAGGVRAPMDIGAAKSDARGAAMKAILAVESYSQGLAVHPRSGDKSFPEFALERCTQCKRCTEECPFGTLDEDEKGTPKPNPNRCRRCGICLGACPERIISFKTYNVNMMSKMIQSISMPEEFDEKPRILIFICENDALPSLDIAAMKRLQFSSFARFIPVRCLGAINVIWINDALASGFDGVLLIGCKSGDDYQCHFVKGSELAEYRMEKVQEKLKQLALEDERVQVTTLGLTEYDKVPGVINDFVEEIEDIGYNPFKDL